MVSKKLKIKIPKSEKEIEDRIHTSKSRFLSVSTSIEAELEVIMADYFSRGDFDDYQLFSHLFYGKETELMFRKKIMIFEKFLKKVYPSYLKSNKDFINSLERVRKLRNKFAHHINPRKSDLTSYVGKSHFPLHYMEDGLPKTEVLTYQDVANRFDDFSNILVETEKIMKHCQIKWKDKLKK